MQRNGNPDEAVRFLETGLERNPQSWKGLMDPDLANIREHEYAKLLLEAHSGAGQ